MQALEVIKPMMVDDNYHRRGTRAGTHGMCGLNNALR